MAKKNTKFNLKDLQFDRELELPDMNFDVPMPADDRKPESSVKRFAKGAAQGAKDAVFSTAFIKKAIKTALPDGFGQALGLAEEAQGMVKDLYNTSARELKPSLAELQRATGRLLPAGEKYIPDNLNKSLKNWADKGKRQSASSGEDYRENELQTTMSEVFTHQVKDLDRREKRQDIKAAVKENIDQKRHRDQLGQLDAIRVSTAALQNYLQLDATYKRKSLELQYRHYFVAADQLAESKRMNAQTEALLADIRKNTGLPDFAKLKNTERIKEVMRNQFIDSFADGALAKRRDFVKNFGASLAGQVKDRVQRFGEGFRNVAQMGEAIADTNDMTRDTAGLGPEFSRAGLVGMLSGKFGAEALGGAAFKKIKQPLANKFPALNRMGNKLSYKAENAPQLIREWAKSDQGDNSIFGGLLRIIKDAALDASGGPKTGLDLDSLGNLQEPMPLTRQTNKSINEVIPGYLAMILREQQIARTGDTSTELTKYDFKKNRFDTDSNVKKTLFKSLVSDDSVRRNKEGVEGLLKEIDPDGKLSEEQRAVLGRQLMDDNLKNRPGSKERLMDPWQYSGKSARWGHDYAEAFSRYFQNDTDNSKQLKFSRSYNRLGEDVDYKQKDIQNYANAGLLDFLRDSGIVTDNGTIDVNKLNEYGWGGEYAPSGSPANPNGPGPTPGPDQRRRRRTGPPPRPNPNPGPVPPTPQPSQTFDWERLDKSLTQLNPNDNLVKLGEILERIDGRIANGLLTYTIIIGDQTISEDSGGGGGPGPNGPGPDGGGGGPDWFRRFRGPSPNDALKWYQQSVGALFKKGATATLSGLKSGKAWLGKQFSTVRDIAGKAAGFGKDLINSGADYVTRFRDIYVPGEEFPRILGAKLKQGLYFDDATGRPLKSFRDISGAVYEFIDGEKHYVLTEDEAHVAYAKSRAGAQLLASLGALTGKLKEFGNRLSGGVLGMALAAKDTAKSVFNLGMGKLDGPRDVYVHGRKGPALLAVTMRAGAYYSKVSGKVIKKVSDIDGPVAQLIDGHEEIKLTEDELGQGLLDAEGKPLRVGLSRITGAIGDAVKTGWNVLKNAGRGVRDFLGRGFNFMGDIITKKGLIIFGGKELLDHVAAIRKLLEDRLPGGKVFGDTDGDGIRDGSVEDLRKKRKDKNEKEDEEKKKGDEDKKGGLLAGLAGLLGFGKKKKDDDEEEDDKDGDSWLDDAADVADIADWADGDGNDRGKKGGRRGGRNRVRGGKPGKAGFLKRAFGGMKKGAGKVFGGAGKWLTGGGNKALGGARMAGTAATLALAAPTAYSLATDKTLTGDKKTEGWADLGGNVAGGLTGMELGASIGTLGGPIGVVIGGAVGGLLGGIFGSKLTTGIKSMFDKKPGPLGLLRIAQYGFVKDDNEYIQQLLDMESKLMPGITFDERGVARLDGDKVPVNDIVKDFGVDLANPAQTGRWIDWFNNRFKLVFLTHLSALKKIKDGTDLDKVDQGKLSQEEQKKFLDIVRWPDGPYDYMGSPFPALERLHAGRTEVAQAEAYAREQIEKGATKTSNDKPGGRAAFQMGDPLAKKDADAAKAAAAVGATAGTVAAADAALGGKKPGETPLQRLLPDYANIDDSGYSKTGGTISAVAGLAPVSQTFQGRVDAASVVRFKTYGLKEMEADKVRSLAQLEDAAEKYLKFNTQGKAEFNGDPNELFRQCGPGFGVDSSNPTQTAAWLTWFKQRFLPVYLNFASALMAATRKPKLKDALAALQPQGELNVALAVYATNQPSGEAVWLSPYTPWPGYALNFDVTTTNANIQALKDAAKDGPLSEQAAADKDNTPGSDKKDKFGANTADQAAKESKGFWDSTKNAASSAWDATKNAVSSAWEGTKKMAGDVAGAVGGAVNAGLDAIGMGRSIEHPGKGTGGDINAIPMPKGDGSANALKELIYAASKMAGVDPNMMMTMAAIESGFKASVKAGTSSATGLYQFISDTWKTMLKKYGAKYGIAPNTSPTDPRANALMGAEFIKENVNALKTVKTNITDTDVYMAHFMGSGGAKKFLKALNNNPQAIAAQLMPDAARANKGIYYEKNGTPKTMQGVYQHLNNLVRNKGKQFGLGSGGGTEAIIPTKPGAAKPGAATTTGATPSAPTTGGMGTDAPKPGAIPTAAPGAMKQSPIASGPIVPNGGYNASVAGAAAGGGGAATTPGDTYAPRAPVVDDIQREQVAVQRRATQAQQTVSTDGLETIAKNHLEVSRSMDATLSKILAALTSVGSAAKPAGANTPNNKSPERMSKPPVSVAKPT